MSEPVAEIAGRFEQGVHILPIRIYYEDTDFSGIVYHANYLRYAERGRSDFLRLAGVSHQALLRREPPLAFAIRRMEIDFIAPARIDEVLEVRTIFCAARGARLEARQAILKDGEAIWRAEVLAASIDTGGRARRLPAEVAEALGPHLRADFD